MNNPYLVFTAFTRFCDTFYAGVGWGQTFLNITFRFKVNLPVALVIRVTFKTTTTAKIAYKQNFYTISLPVRKKEIKCFFCSANHDVFVVMSKMCLTCP